MDRQRRLLMIEKVITLAQLPPDSAGHKQLVIEAIIKLSSFPPNPVLDLKFRMFSNYEAVYGGRDVFGMLSDKRYEFFQATGESPESFLRLVNDIHVEETVNNTLSKTNRILLFMMWLRSYPTYRVLSLFFNMSLSSVKDLINGMVPIFKHTLSPYIHWLTVEQWEELQGNWPKIYNAIGAIDGTSHEINRPTEHQEQYYSGHRKYHCLHSQIIIDNTGTIRHVESGFLGHQNDAQHFQLMLQIPRDLPFPLDCFLLGDKIYPNGYPILTQYSGAQLRMREGENRRRCLRFNRYVRRYRVRVEHVIGQIKTYKCISSVWRHKRAKLSAVVHICSALTCRKKYIGLTL